MNVTDKRSRAQLGRRAPAAPDAAADPEHDRADSGDGALIEYHADAGILRSRGVTRFEVALLVLLSLAMLVPGIWSYSLVDPWETHDAEVARRMLQDDDWVHTKWQNEGFRSKPVLSFWMIAASMQTVGVGDGGGFSGEMTSSGMVMFATRIPFVLFGVLGLVMLWWMLASLVNRRVAWLTYFILITSPFYFFVARQAITDMPLLGCLIGTLSCFAMAIHAGDKPLRPLLGPINALHIFLAALILFVGWQIGYYALFFHNAPHLGPGVRFPSPQLLPALMLVGLIGFIVWVVKLQPVREARQVYMLWFYLLISLSVLAKGLPGIGLAGAICFLYVLITNSWRVLPKLEIPRGILLALLIVIPWHVAMWLKDGRPFIRDYVIGHNFRRLTQGMHGPRGTFNFFTSQIGIGMWPWAALLPGAVARVVTGVTGQTRVGRVRLIIGIWAIVSMALFASSQTKFHHYILPAVPALAVMIAFWLDDLLSGRVRRIGLLLVAAAGIVLLIMRDLMGEQKQFIELYIYRYDRPWPSGEPWNVDLSDPILGFGLVFAGLLLLMIARPLRRIGLALFIAACVIASLWSMNVYMRYAGMHWGMRTAMQTYYQQRQIHGVDIQYYGSRQIYDEWRDFSGTYMVESVIPEHLSPGQPMKLNITVAGRSGPAADPVTLRGAVSRIGEHRLWVKIPDAELAKLAPLIAKGKKLPSPRVRPWRQVNADRLIAWQLYWRGENFWSGDEIFGRIDDTKTAFKDTDNKKFLKYLKADGREGRRYYLITESGRARNLRNILPTQTAKDTYEIIDRSSNKFTLVRFTL